MWTIFRVFIEFITILLPAYALVLLLLLSLFLMLWCFRLQGILALSSLTRNWTSTPGTGRGSLNPWAPREVPASCNFKYSLDSRGILSALGLLLSTRFLCLGLGYACRRNTIKVSSLNIFPFSPNTEVQQKYGYFRWSVFSFQIVCLWIQAALKKIAGLVPGHHSNVSIMIKWVMNFLVFQYIYKLYLCSTVVY